MQSEMDLHVIDGLRKRVKTLEIAAALYRGHFRACAMQAGRDADCAEWLWESCLEGAKHRVEVDA